MSTIGVCAHDGARCWPCQAGQCYDEPQLHPWWDEEDVEHAANAGRPPPSGDCGCAWCGRPALNREG